jgi:long-chain acyl-CoA synthetase
VPGSRRPVARSLPELLEQVARRRPDADALVHGARRLSYRALASHVASLASRLRGEGIGPADRVALLQENSPEYVIGYYAVLSVGAVAVALSPAAKARELGNLLEHSGAALLLADPRHSELAQVRHACPAVPVLALEPNAIAPVSGSADELAPVPLTADSLAAIVYTSGTTGRPKGAMLSHGNLVSNTRAIIRYLQLSPADRVLCVLPFQYAYGSSVLHSHLAAGACIVIENSLVYPHRVLESMQAEQVTGFAGVPSTYALLLARTRLQGYRLERLRYLTQAGGPMPAAQILRVRSLLPQADFFVMYGQTEATARLTYLPPARLQEKLGSVGVPVEGTEISIRDLAGHALSPGEVGEVWARGPGVMQGYWRDPALSAQALVDGWLRTGDLGRFDGDGFLYLEGRAVDMIKTGAYRVAPREVEEVVAELDGVAEVVALGVPDPLLGQVIMTVVVPAAGVELDANRIRAHCRRHLAHYKIPKLIRLASALPRTGSGKVQRYQLQTDIIG